MPLFWVDVSAYIFSTVIAIALALTVVASGLRRILNRFFALFVLIAATWTTGAVLLRLSLWMERGNALFWGELGAVAFVGLGPSLAMFAARYVNRRSWRVHLAVIVGFVLVTLIAVPIFRHQVVYGHYLGVNGTTHHVLSPLGFGMSLVPVAYLIWSLLLLWEVRLQPAGRYFLVSVFILLAGLLVGGVLDIPFPVLSFTTMISVITLGYGVLSQQVFNPLRERTAELQREVAERKRIEAALRGSEQFLQDVFDAIQDGISILDCDLNIVRVNRWIQKMHADQEPIFGKKCYVVYQQRQSICPWCPSVRAIETGEAHTEIVPYPSSDRPTGWMELSAFPLKNVQGQVTGIIEYVKDITQRRQAELEIVRLQHLLQNITDSMPSALIALDQQGHVLTWNPAAEKMTGTSSREIEGRSVWAMCPELVRYRNLFEQVLRQRQGARWHREQLNTESGVMYRDVSAFPLATNEVNGVVLRIDDVTSLVQLEEMMLQSAKMASVGRLAAGVAHELNNPLGAMMQSAQMVQRALDVDLDHTRQLLEACGVSPQALQRYLDERALSTYLLGIRETGMRAAKIVADLLSFSRKSASEFAPHDLNLLVEQTLELAATDYDLKKTYDFRNIEITCSFDDGLPKVACDGQQIQQVVLNLVRNAAQSMTNKRLEMGAAYQPHLVIRTLLHSGWARLEIEDNGPGISDEVRERLFEPFFTTKPVGEGTGLGLWLCWSIIVERHGGHIWVDAGGEGGATFILELPIS